MSERTCTDKVIDFLFGGDNAKEREERESERCPECGATGEYGPYGVRSTCTCGDVFGDGYQ